MRAGLKVVTRDGVVVSSHMRPVPEALAQIYNTPHRISALQYVLHWFADAYFRDEIWQGNGATDWTIFFNAARIATLIESIPEERRGVWVLCHVLKSGIDPGLLEPSDYAEKMANYMAANEVVAS